MTNKIDSIIKRFCDINEGSKKIALGYDKDDNFMGAVSHTSNRSALKLLKRHLPPEERHTVTLTKDNGKGKITNIKLAKEEVEPPNETTKNKKDHLSRANKQRYRVDEQLNKINIINEVIKKVIKDKKDANAKLPPPTKVTFSPTLSKEQDS